MSLLEYCPTAEFYQRDVIIQKTLTDSHNTESRKYNLADYQNICQAIDITKNITGAYVEIGVMYGTSANVAVNYMKNKSIDRESYFFDTFEGFKYIEAEKSLDILWNDTHFIANPNDHIKMIEKLINPNGNNNIHVLRNNIITDDLPENIKKIAICNLDVDMYEAVRAGLFKVAPYIAKKWCNNM